MHTTDATAGTITLDEISGDVIEASERHTDLRISGTTTGIEQGQVASVEFNGHTYSGTVQSNGSFSVTVPAAAVGALTDTTRYTATANVSDRAGNSATPDTEDVHTTSTYVAPIVTASVDISHGGVVQPPNAGTGGYGGHQLNPILDANMHQLQHDLGGRSITRVYDEVKDGEGSGKFFIFTSTGGEQVNMEKGNDFLYVQGTVGEKLTGKEGRDTLILGSYSSHDLTGHGDSLHLGHADINDWENIMTNDGVWVKGGPPAGFDAHYFQTTPPPTYEYDADVNVQLSTTDDSVTGIRISHLAPGITVKDYQGQEIHPHNGVYSIDSHHMGITLVSDHALDAQSDHFITEVDVHNRVTGQDHTVAAVQSASDEAPLIVEEFTFDGSVEPAITSEQEAPATGADTGADAQAAGVDTGTDAQAAGVDAGTDTQAAGADTGTDAQATGVDAGTDAEATGADTGADAQAAGVDTGTDAQAAGSDVEAPDADTSKDTVAAETALTTDSGDDFDLGNAGALLDDAKADKAATATKEALEKVAGLLEEHPDSVEEKLVKLVENAPVKEHVPAEHAAPSHSADQTSEDSATHEPQVDHADYVPPPSHNDDDDLHHDGTGLT